MGICGEPRSNGMSITHDVYSCRGCEEHTLPTPMSAETRPPELMGRDQLRVAGSQVRLTGSRLDTMTRFC